MRAGRLDRLITIQTGSGTLDDWGQPTPGWSDVKHREPASWTAIEGSERFGGDQWSARQQVEFRVHYCEATAAITPKDRVIYPAPDTADLQDPPFSTLYDIMAVDEIGRREGISIKAARRPDVS